MERKGEGGGTKSRPENIMPHILCLLCSLKLILYKLLLCYVHHVYTCTSGVCVCVCVHVCTY